MRAVITNYLPWLALNEPDEEPSGQEVPRYMQVPVGWQVILTFQHTSSALLLIFGLG